MAVQLAPVDGDMYDSKRGRGGDSRAMGLYEGNSRPRSKSVVDSSRQYTRDGRVILHFGKLLSVHAKLNCTNKQFRSTCSLHVSGGYPRRAWIR